MNNILKNKLKTLLFLSCLAPSVTVFAQVGMGRENPRGVLDVNNPNGYSNTGGIVLPKTDNMSNITATDGAKAVPGTIVYENPDHCIHLMTAQRDWTDCLLDAKGIKDVATNVLSVGADFKIKAASMGLQHTLVIGKDDNAVYATGDNSNARTGMGRTSGNTQTFTLMFAQPVVSVAAGYNHSMAVDVLGQVWAWGNNANYRTGLPDDGDDLGSAGDTGTPVMVTGSTSLPIPVFGERSSGSFYGKAVQVEAGRYNSFVLIDTADIANSGEVYAVGRNTNGTAGTGTTSGDTATWTKLNIPEKVVQISSSVESAAAVTQTGKVYVWGTGANYRLGTGATANVSSPTQISIPGAVPVKKVSMGYNNGAAISQDGKHLFVWGAANTVGLGNTNTMLPTEVTLPGFDPATDEILDVAAQRFTYGGLTVLTTKGILSTGRNANGQGGTGTTTNIATSFLPANTVGVVQGTKFIGVERGENATILITDENLQHPDSSYVGYGMGQINYRQLGAIIIQNTVPTQLTK